MYMSIWVQSHTSLRIWGYGNEEDRWLRSSATEGASNTHIGHTYALTHIASAELAISTIWVRMCIVDLTHGMHVAYTWHLVIECSTFWIWHLVISSLLQLERSLSLSVLLLVSTSASCIYMYWLEAWIRTMMVTIKQVILIVISMWMRWVVTSKSEGYSST